MRCEKVSVSFKYPVRVNEPDCNGYVYTEDAIIQACKNADDKPIVQYNEKGEPIVVGVTNKVWFENGYVNVDALAWHGGTCESVLFDEQKKITEMNIFSFSICK